MKRLAALAVMLFALAALAQQQPDIPRLGETIDVSIINVEVFVTDRNGNRVTGLTKDDFEIREDGKLRAITNFLEYGEPIVPQPEARVGVEAAPARTAEQQQPRARRILVFFIEKQYLWPEHRDDFFRSLHEIIDNTMDEGDEGMVVSYHAWTKVEQRLTGDRKALHKALDHLARTTVPHLIDPSRQARQQIADDLAFEASLGGRFDSGPLRSEGETACAMHEMTRLRRKTDAITSVLESLGGLDDARKVMIMATRRFGAVAGLDCFAQRLSSDQRNRFRTDELRNRVAATANANGVTIYPIHPENLPPVLHDLGQRFASEGAPIAVLEHEVMLNEMDAAREIAAKTGGLAEWGPEAVKIVSRVEEDLDRYYSLGYRAVGTSEDRPRSIIVTVKRPGLTVRSRKQFVEKSPNTRMRDRVIGNLAFPIDGATIDFAVDVGDIRRDSKRRLAVPVKVRIPIAALTTVPEGKDAKGAFTVYIAAGGALAASHVTQKTQSFTIPVAELEKAKRSNFTYESEVTVDNNTDNVSIGVLDEVGRDFGLAKVDVKARTTPSRG